MFHEIPKQPPQEGENIASIDIGSHTVRMLVAERQGSPDLFRPLLRKRGYSRLAEGFGKDGDRLLQPQAIDRALTLLDDCSLTLQEYGIAYPQAISTGVVRDAVNQDNFIQQIYNQTGIRAQVISGEQEALLTKMGVLHSLDSIGKSSIIFDLGGGTTEFVNTRPEGTSIQSLPIGAVVFTQQFFDSDPPRAERIDNLSSHIRKVLEQAFPEKHGVEENPALVGSGGTVTTLGAMINQIAIKDITPEKLNGMQINRDQVETLFSSIKTIPIKDRLQLIGLDEGRAEVILAGTLAIIRIMHFFKTSCLTVSFSDLLEGALIQYLRRETYEQK